jgi:hypothetical protein
MPIKSIRGVAVKESEIGLLLSFEPIRAPPSWNDAARVARAIKIIDLTFEARSFLVWRKPLFPNWNWISKERKFCEKKY